MRSKPRGVKYRNLNVYRGSIWYRRVVDARRFRVDTRTTDWAEATRFRDLYEEKRRVERAVGSKVTFGELAERYLEEDTGHLATRTRRDRKRHLGEDGSILPYFGRRRLDEITPAMLREWWGLEIEAHKHRTTPTGRHHLSTIAAVFGFAKDLGFTDYTPVPDFRAQITRRTRTKRGRADATLKMSIRPIEDPADLARLVDAAREEGAVSHVLVLLLLDAGLRLGEAIALRWGSIVWGEGNSDRTRMLIIDRSSPSGLAGAIEPTKSGRMREVGLSMRLRGALKTLQRTRFEPGPRTLVLKGLDADNFRKREWRRICQRADVGHRALKDLRDTYASQLLTAGVQLGYVSRQLGHASVVTTSNHYARWCGGAEYREPISPGRGELPADLLQKLDEKWSQSGHKSNSAKSDK